MSPTLASITSLDQHILRWIVGNRIGVLNFPFKVITYAAVGGTIWIVVALLLAWRTRRPILPIGVLVAAAVWFADGIANLLKAVTNRPRPYLTMRHLHLLIARPSSGSFPSQHATTAFAGATLLAFLWPQGRLAFFLAAILVAFSRLYVGVHYPSDVLAGALIGCTAAAAGILLVKHSRLRHRVLRPASSERRWV